MIIDMGYWIKVLKRCVLLIISFIGVFLLFKLAKFYLPFLVAFIISLFLEPLIRWLMKKIKLSRRISSLIILILSFTLILTILFFIVSSLIKEIYNLIQNMNFYIERIYQMTDFITQYLDISKLNIPQEIFSLFDKSSRDFINHSVEFMQTFLRKILNFITSMPTIGIYIVITILATYFICADRLYILDQMEHHFPKLWVKRIGNHIKDISHKLGNYLKAELILVSISFFIILVGLYIFKWIGFDIKYPLLMALIIGFVDALPILGSGTIMLPWAIISAMNNQLRFGIYLLVLYIITVIVRQFLEPKIVGNQIGIHPIFTLIAMYTGFEVLGIFGILLGPIILIIVKDIYSTLIDKGVVKSILERK